MHWSRIKSIFIVVFLLLNSFLGYQLWEKKTKKIELAQSYENSIDELLLLKNIRLLPELDIEQPELPQLNVQFLSYTFRDLALLAGQHVTIDDHKLIATLVEPYSLAEPWEEAVFFQDFVKEQVMNGEQYRFDAYFNQRIVYLQHVAELPIFGGTLQFQLNHDQEVTGYEQIYYHVINQATPQPVISSFTCLRTLLENGAIPAEAAITRLTLGYFGQIYEANSQILTPTWRVSVMFQDERLEYFVNAYTGAIVVSPMIGELEVTM